MIIRNYEGSSTILRYATMHKQHATASLGVWFSPCSELYRHVSVWYRLRVIRVVHGLVWHLTALMIVHETPMDMDGRPSVITDLLPRLCASQLDVAAESLGYVGCASGKLGVTDLRLTVGSPKCVEVRESTTAMAIYHRRSAHKEHAHPAII